MDITSDLMGSYISFSVYPSALYGSGFQNALVKAILDWETASSFIDAATVHAQVYSTLPSTTPNDYTKYNYVKLQLESGEILVLGIPWINPSTVEVSGAQTFIIRCPNQGSGFVTKATNALLANGINGFTIAPE